MEEINLQLSEKESLSLRRYKNVIKNLKIILWEWDLKRDKWAIFAELQEKSNLIGVNLSGNFEEWKSRVHPMDLKSALQAFRNYLNREIPEYKCEYRLKLDDNKYSWIQSSGTAVWDSKGKAIGISGYFIDISERKEIEEKVKYLAYYDNLTGLSNRNLLEYKLRSEIASMSFNYEKHGIAVLYMDLDNFKDINETKGHAFGDEVLKQVSIRLKETLKIDNVLARTGGDEFIFMIPCFTSMEEIESVSEIILEQFRYPLFIASQEINLTASAGIALYPEDGKDEQSLLKSADTALHFAKKAGKNNYKFYSEEMKTSVSARLKMEKRLRDAVNNEEFIVYYQPQVKVNTEEVIGMEALVRWIRPGKGVIPPADFIPLAEETGLILPIGEFVLRTACKQNKCWQESGLKPIRVSVNLSPRQFVKQNLVKLIAEVLEETKLEPHWLEVEITESLAMDNLEFTIDTLNQIRKMGVHIALDDFGTGYSSLNYLRKLPIDTLKIDKSFIDRVDQCSDDKAITRTIISLAQSLKLDIVAEGVENIKQFCFLREHNCDRVQGYLFSKPLPPEELEKYIYNI